MIAAFRLLRHASILLLVALLRAGAAFGAPAPVPVGAIDFAGPQPVIDLGLSLAPERIAEPSDPRGSWFSVTVANGQAEPVDRVLTAFSAPRASLAFQPLPARPTIVQVVPSDPAAVVERAIAFGPDAFRVVVPPRRSVTIALHFENALPRQPVLAWTEPALIADNRQSSVLDGLIVGLFTAATLLSAAAAGLSSRVLAGWAALFLFSVLMADLTASGFLDFTGLAAISGPYGLFAIWISLAVAAAIRVIDYVAPFEAFWRHGAKWRDRVALVVIGAGVAAYASAPAAGLMVRVCALVGAAAAAGYLSHCGRIGVAAARRLAPAATVFALVTAAAGLNALGFFGVNLTASSALSGFSAAGALIVAIASTIPADHSILRLRDLREAHSHDDLQATKTDETIEREWELVAMAASQQGVFDLDLKSGNLTLSKEAAVLFGFRPAAVELSIETWIRRIAPEDRDFFAETLAAYHKQTETPFRVEFRILQGHGVRWCELRATVTGQEHAGKHCLGLIADASLRDDSNVTRQPVASAISA